MQADTSLAEEGTGGSWTNRRAIRHLSPSPRSPQHRRRRIPSPRLSPPWVDSARCRANTRTRVRTHRRVDPARRQQVEPDHHPGRGRHRCDRGRRPRVHHLHRLAGPTPRRGRCEDFGRRLLEMPEFEARYGDVDSPERPIELGRELGTTALRPPRRPTSFATGSSPRPCSERGRQRLRSRSCARRSRPNRRASWSKALDERPVPRVVGGHLQGLRGRAEGTPGPPPHPTPTCRRRPSHWRTRWASMR